MKHRRLLFTFTAVAVGAAGVLVPAGAGAGVSRRAPALTLRLNGSSYAPPVYVGCAPGARTGTPVGKNRLVTRAKGNVRMTVTFLADDQHPVVLWGSRRASLPTKLRLPCSGTGKVRYRVERITRRRSIGGRALGLPVVRAMATFAAVGRNRTQLLERSVIPVVFVATAS